MFNPHGSAVRNCVRQGNRTSRRYRYIRRCLVGIGSRSHGGRDVPPSAVCSWRPRRAARVGPRPSLRPENRGADAVNSRSPDVRRREKATSQLEEREDACLRVIVDAHADGRRHPRGEGTCFPRPRSRPSRPLPDITRRLLPGRRPAQEMTCCRGVPLCPLCTRESRLGEPRGRGGRAPRPPRRPESSLPFPVGYARVVFLVFLCFFITTRTQDKI